MDIRITIASIILTRRTKTKEPMQIVLHVCLFD